MNILTTLNFLQNPEIQKAINNNDFDYVYDELYKYTNPDTMGAFSHILREANINPIQYMNKIPTCYYANSDIEEYKIPNNIREVGELAFARCMNLKKLYIPKSVVAMHIHSFFMCMRLTHIYYEGTKQNFNHISKPSKWISLFGNIDYMPKVTEVFCSDGIITINEGKYGNT